MAGTANLMLRVRRLGCGLPAIVLLAALLVEVLTVASAGAQQSTPLGPDEVSVAQQTLADRYLPVAMMRQQSGACDRRGEPYLPAPVSTVLGNPRVALKQHLPGRPAKEDRVIKMGPVASDLVGLGEDFYLDLPGNPRQPRCDFEKSFKEAFAGKESVVYVKIATQRGEPGLALQYWYFWYFDDFLNTHESDWEMIQYNFEAATAEEALTMEPTDVVFAQHGGGERAAWGDDKIELKDGRMVVYPAAGSHATYFSNAVFLGWGENGTGFGCDYSDPPSFTVPMKAVVMPDNPSLYGEFAWLHFGGRWGERQPWEYNGPKGPNLGRKWSEPVTWIETARDSSIAIPESSTLGPAPTNVFCSLAGAGGRVLTIAGVHPNLVKWGVLACLLVIVAIAAMLWRLMAETVAVYLAHIRVFGAIGLIILPIAWIVNGFQVLVMAIPPFDWLLKWIGNTPGSRLAIALTIGSVQQAIMLIVVGPAVVAAMGEVLSGRVPTVRGAYERAFTSLRQLASAFLRVGIVSGLTVISGLLLPVALWYGYRNAFYSQAAILDGALTGRDAMHLSVKTVRGRHWRVAPPILVFAFLAAAPGPLVGIILMIVFGRSAEFVNGVSGLLYATTIPISFIGGTLLYTKLRQAAGTSTTARATIPDTAVVSA